VPRLTKNVWVGGTPYGPDYPYNIVTKEVAEAIVNPSAWDTDPTDRVVRPDLRSRRDDFGADDDEEFVGSGYPAPRPTAAALRADQAAARVSQVRSYSRGDLEAMTSDELKDLALAQGHDIRGRYSKEKLIDTLAGPAPAGGDGE
jgi:uncharacterized protein YjiS (DUF1127 family)